MRASCQSVAVIGLVYSNPDTLMRQKIFHIAGRQLDEWHTKQSQACRSTFGTSAFLVEQVGDGGFLRTLSEALATLADSHKLAEIGFIMPSTRYSTKVAEDESFLLVKENDFAIELGVFVVALVACRLKRMAYL